VTIEKTQKPIQGLAREGGKLEGMVETQGTGDGSIDHQIERIGKMLEEGGLL